jgi:hypothetical protein
MMPHNSIFWRKTFGQNDVIAMPHFSFLQRMVRWISFSAEHVIWRKLPLFTLAAIRSTRFRLTGTENHIKASLDFHEEKRFETNSKQSISFQFTTCFSWCQHSLTKLYNSLFSGYGFHMDLYTMQFLSIDYWHMSFAGVILTICAPFALLFCNTATSHERENTFSFL